VPAALSARDATDPEKRRDQVSACAALRNAVTAISFLTKYFATQRLLEQHRLLKLRAAAISTQLRAVWRSTCKASCGNHFCPIVAHRIDLSIPATIRQSAK
jgi:hypothetical protein